MRIQGPAARRRDSRDRLFHIPHFRMPRYATEMARKLIELASSSADVRRIVAHTLPEANASTRVLEKAGMISWERSLTQKTALSGTGNCQPRPNTGAAPDAAPDGAR